jgi:L-alanine-DL-glutamate epimerase-like enolase superfamily enzyme
LRQKPIFARVSTFSIVLEVMMAARGDSAIGRVAVSVYSIPTDAPEADGTYRWDRTALVLVEVAAGGKNGLGYTYADAATGHLIHDHLAPIISGRNACDIAAAWVAMAGAVRNLGRPGVASMAISAVDAALWDLKAKFLGLPLVALLGAAREAAPVYGSGGFTSYSDEQLEKQFSGWARQGISRMKMKVGAHPDADLHRVKVAREAIGPERELFVDANGAYSRKQALRFAEQFAELGVTWFEEPVSSDDLDGLRLLRDRGPAGMDVAAGEYGYDLPYFRRMLAAGAVDVLQADASRCGGITGFLKAAGLCEAFGLPLSAHCAPALHAHPCCAATAQFRHLEYFHDHARIENMLFDGVLRPEGGALRPDRSRPGLGLEFKHKDAEKFKVWTSEGAK